MNPWKAPGPDSFPVGFYQKLWDILGSNVCDFVRRVWEKHDEIEVVNQTNIYLIPKVEQPITIMQFCPISL